VRAVIDTSVLIRHERGLRTRLPEDAAVSAATLAELGLGVLLTDDPGQRATRLATLTRVEREFEALPIDRVVAQRYAEIVAEARRHGRRPKAMDALIAATALAHGVPVVTADEGFQAMPFVEVIVI